MLPDILCLPRQQKQMGAGRVPHGVETGFLKGYPAGTRREPGGFVTAVSNKGPVRAAHMDYPDRSWKTNSSYTLQELGGGTRSQGRNSLEAVPALTPVPAIPQFGAIKLQYPIPEFRHILILQCDQTTILPRP
jgi:hypothetical protein